MAAIVVLGSLNMDIAALAPRLPQAGETLIGSHFHTAPGGKGANQAYAAAKLGRAGSTAMLGRVGDDDFGRQMIANLYIFPVTLAVSEVVQHLDPLEFLFFQLGEPLIRPRWIFCGSE